MSPLESIDYDRIQSIIDRAIQPIQSELRQMMPKDESISRHTANLDRIAAMEKSYIELRTSIADIAKWVLTENEKIRSSIGERFNSLDEKINEVNNQISLGRAATLRYIISVIVSVVTGLLLGGVSLFGILQAMHVFH